MNNALAHAKEIDPTIELDDVKQVVIIYDEQKKKSHGAHSFVAHDNTSKYQIDMFVLLRTLRTTDMRQGSAALIYVLHIAQSYQSQERPTSDLALGFIARMHKMGGRPQLIMTDGEGAVHNSGLFFQKYFTEHNLTHIPSSGRPVFAGRMLKTLREMLDKRIKPINSGLT